MSEMTLKKAREIVARFGQRGPHVWGDDDFGSEAESFYATGFLQGFRAAEEKYRGVVEAAKLAAEILWANGDNGIARKIDRVIAEAEA